MKRAAAMLLVALLAACASERPVREGPAAQRAQAFSGREREVALLLMQAERLRLAGERQAAAQLYHRADEVDPGNARAKEGLAAIDAAERHEHILGEANRLFAEGRLEEAADKARLVLAEDPHQREALRLARAIDEKTQGAATSPPRLRIAGGAPMSLDVHDLPVRAVFDIIARTAGLNFVFDREVRQDQRVSITVRDAAVEDVIRLVLATNQLEEKVITDSTVLVYPNTVQKQREYQELVVKVFYVGNADVKQTANMLRLMLKMRDVFVDEKLGMVVVKDTAPMVRLAERLIAAQDLAEPEVMLDVEVLEVATSRLLQLGLKYPSSIGVGVSGSGGPGTLTLRELRSGDSGLVQFTVSNPLFLLLLDQEDTGTSVLANPRIRVKNKDKARIHIGDRVPVITTTAAATGGFVSESVTYLDVGLKLEVEPVIDLQDEVSIKVGLEVSNIVREVRSTSNTLTYQIGTRNAATNLRLKDGETQVLAGLINDEDRRSASRVPGLGDLPIVGRLFSQTSDSKAKTEIVLLITPHILRSLERPAVRATEFSAGTELSAGAGTFSSAAPPPPAAQPGSRAPTPPASGAPVPPATSVSPFPPGSPLTPPGMVPFGGPQPR